MDSWYCDLDNNNKVTPVGPIYTTRFASEIYHLKYTWQNCVILIQSMHKEINLHNFYQYITCPRLNL